MESKEFIKSKLETIFSKFDGIQIRYEYRNNLFTHFIEIKPLDLFQNDLGYVDLEIELEDEFSELFPGEELLFISTDSLNQIINPEYELGDVDETYFNFILDNIEGILIDTNTPESDFEIEHTHPKFGTTFKTPSSNNIVTAGEDYYALAA